MSRKSSCSSQKNHKQEAAVAHDIEETYETTQTTSSVTTHVTASHSAGYSSSMSVGGNVGKGAPPALHIETPSAHELQYAPPPPQPHVKANKSESVEDSKPPLPMAAKPVKAKDPQMAFDFNGNACNEVIARQLNLEQRDEHGINGDLKTHFLDIFAEPDPQYHSVACVWTTSYRVFEITRIYCYKIFTLIFGLPVALIAGFIFALFTFLRIWITTPLLTLLRMVLGQMLSIWPLCLLYIVRPFFYSVGAIFSTFRLHRSDGPIIKEIWEKQTV
ncbi:unnamed protein product [Haemonchus placei]|uniref:Caveolin n=1 Tax=Haemonchus placei TaxID=6290 RepID=A0A0N4WRR6_HAEPC|nr:unnamed protein product [Haemonchus placei]